jgi:PAS domain-containing protein
MSENEPVETSGGVAVLDVGGGKATQALLVWADENFREVFEGATVGAAAFGADADAQVTAAVEGLQQGAVARFDVPSGTLFGHRLESAIGIVGLGGKRVLLALATDPEMQGQTADSRLAETLDAVPVAASLIQVSDGTILWLNENFRELLDGSEFDLMGTSLADHFALPGAFATLMSATDAIAPSTPVPTPLKTLSGIMTPVVATAKRMRFRGQDAALVCLASGF